MRTHNRVKTLMSTTTYGRPWYDLYHLPGTISTTYLVGTLGGPGRDPTTNTHHMDTHPMYIQHLWCRYVHKHAPTGRLGYRCQPGRWLWMLGLATPLTGRTRRWVLGASRRALRALSVPDPVPTGLSPWQQTSEVANG